MKQVAKADIKIGMVVAESVTDSKRQVLLEADTKLTKTHIEILQTWDLDYIRIKESSLEPSMNEEVAIEAKTAEEETRLSSEEIKKALGVTEENVRRILSGRGDAKLYAGARDVSPATGAVNIGSLLNHTFLDTYLGMMKQIEKLFGSDTREREMFIKDCNEFAAKLNHFIRKTVGIFGYCLYPYKLKVSALASHTMRTAIIAGKIAQLLEYNNKDSLIIIMGALLHDIGCATLPEDMKNSKRKYNADEQAFYKKHVLTGVNMLKSSKYLPREVLLIVGSHHELLDGSGYPLQLKADKIPSIVRVVSFANQIDRVLYPYTGTNRMSLNQLVDEMPHWANKFDEKICLFLGKYLEDFILSNRVTLGDGRLAEIIWRHKSYKEPVVRTSDGEIIDLNKAAGLSVESYSI